MSRAARYVERQLLADRHFLYNAFAPLRIPGEDVRYVLVKVGISTVPMKRLVAIQCNSQFPLEFASFTPVGDMRMARSAESAILRKYRTSQTRGEWLLLANDAECKREFSESVRKILERTTRQPVTWARVTKDELSAEVREGMRRMTG